MRQRGFCTYASTAGLAAVVLGRASGRTLRAPLLAAEAAIPLLLVTTGANLAAALAGRRRIPALVSAVLAGAELHWIWPGVARRRDDTGERGELRLLAANLLYSNRETLHLAGQIRAERPDVLFLTEASSRSVGPLLRSGVLADYPYEAVFLREDAAGLALFSRFPLRDTHLVPISERHLVSARLVVHDRVVHLLGVHPRAPTMGPRVWASELAAIGAAGAAVAGPLIIAGDFNASRDHIQLRRLEAAAGVRDAHDAVGKGFSGTWPADRRFPPLFRLDHILVSNELRVSAAATGDIRGSDHRWIQADISFVDAASASAPLRASLQA